MKKMSAARRKEARSGLAYAALPLTGFMVFFVVPFGISIFRTFQSAAGGQYFVGFGNYTSLLRSDAFRLALVNTLKFIGVGVPVIILIALAAALALNSKVKGKRAFRTLFVMPLVVPVSSVILVFQIVFERSGIINTFIMAMGRTPSDYLNSNKAFLVLIVLYVWKNCGYNIVLFLAGLSQIPAEYYDAAKADGASSLRVLLSITLPLLIPTLFFNFVMCIVNAFKVFREAYALGGAYPHDSIYMLQHFMNNNFRNLNYSRLSVASFLTFLVILTLVYVLFRFRQKAGDYQL